MNSNAQAGTESPILHSPAGQTDGRDTHDAASENSRPVSNDPAAEALLRRFLSEVNGYRQVGNAALRELEDRLTTLSRQHTGLAAAQQRATMVAPAPARSASAHTVAAESPRPAQPRGGNGTANGDERSLTERLRELTTYLHDDLSKQDSTKADGVRASSASSARSASGSQRQSAFKATPSAPVLDRAWFEERFAAMRASIHNASDSLPMRRLEALETQFGELMERLDRRDAANEGMGQVETSLKRLAVYLEDSKLWAVSHDKRLRGVEDKLNHLSGLVAQSHAAIAATAKGLEIVAKGTGTRLARATADMVVSQLEDKISRMNPVRPIDDLNREVASLSMQSRQYARSTDERLRQLQASLNDSLERQLTNGAGLPASSKTAPAQVPDGVVDYDEEAFDEIGEQDHALISPAQRASKFTGGAERDTASQGEPLRYQIPYGEFLPDDEQRHSNAGLVIAAVILLLASAAMLYLNLRDKDVLGFWPIASLSKMASPAVTGSTPVSDETIGGETVEAKRPARASNADVKPVAAVRMPAGVMLSDDVALNAPQKGMPGTLASTDEANRAAPSVPSGGSVQAAPAATGALDAGKDTSIRAAAVKGDTEAQFHVGQNYLTGRDAERSADPQERLSRAVRWFRRAAENGHVPSQYRLATLYELGQGTAKDFAEAGKWYRRAAEGGHVKAMHNLAVLLAQGQGVTLDHATAAKWFSKAADHGLADSQYNLAVLYERGLGVEQSSVKAFQWYALAARNGDSKAMQRREAVSRRLSAEQIATVAQDVARWTSQPADVAANGAAPEPPASVVEPVKTVLRPEEPRAQVVKASWVTTITPQNAAVVDVQRLLKQLGYRPGPEDGIAGPRTLAAIREFEGKNGFPVTGSVSEVLLAQLTIAQK